jgi:hypothetical protein
MIYLNRTFKIWDATPTKNCLLLRSPKNNVEDLHENIDILFFGVKHLNIPFLFKGLEIREATEVEAKEFNSDEMTYVLINSEHQGIVVAHSYKIYMNDSDIFDSPLNRL